MIQCEVAGLRFDLYVPMSEHRDYLLNTYRPFMVSRSDGQPIFTVTITFDSLCLFGEESEVCQFNEGIACTKVHHTATHQTVIEMSAPDNRLNSHVRFDREYRSFEVALSGNKRWLRWAFDRSLMLAYAYASSRFSTLLVHSSVVEDGSKGYLFLGKSGTGKSTHSQLWIDHIPHHTLLNDDNPIVRIVDGTPMVFGSPWSGKTACYRNHSVEIGAVVRLQQGDQNAISQLSTVQSYAAVLPSCFSLRWEQEITDAIHTTIEELILSRRIYRLECLPNKEAAELCYETICDDAKN